MPNISRICSVLRFPCWYTLPTSSAIFWYRWLNPFGLTPVLPRARAEASPAWVRSRIMFRSCSAKIHISWKNILPIAVVVSMDSERLFKWTPRFWNDSASSISWTVLRPKRSSFQTTMDHPLGHRLVVYRDLVSSLLLPRLYLKTGAYNPRSSRRPVEGLNSVHRWICAMQWAGVA